MAAFKLNRWKRGTSRRSRSRGPTVSGAPQPHDHDSVACTIPRGYKEYRPAGAGRYRADAQRGPSPEASGVFRPLESERQGSGSIWTQSLAFHFRADVRLRTPLGLVRVARQLGTARLRPGGILCNPEE